MKLLEGKRDIAYRIIQLPDIHLLKVLGLRVGSEIVFKYGQPFNGPIVIKSARRLIAIDRDVSEEIIIGGIENE